MHYTLTRAKQFVHTEFGQPTYLDPMVLREKCMESHLRNARNAKYLCQLHHHTMEVPVQLVSHQLFPQKVRFLQALVAR